MPDADDFLLWDKDERGEGRQEVSAGHCKV
jgi:hypothetical protein